MAILRSDDPVQPSKGPRVATLSTFECPIVKFVLRNPTLKQRLYLRWRPRPEAGYVSVEDPDERHNRNQVREEQMCWQVEEVEGRTKHSEWPEEGDCEKRGEVTGLKLEDAIFC